MLKKPSKLILDKELSKLIHSVKTLKLSQKKDILSKIEKVKAKQKKE